MKSKIILIAALLLGSCNKPLDNAQIPDVPAQKYTCRTFCIRNTGTGNKSTESGSGQNIVRYKSVYHLSKRRYPAPLSGGIQIGYYHKPESREYELYAIGNAGKDLGPLDASEWKPLVRHLLARLICKETRNC